MHYTTESTTLSPIETKRVQKRNIINPHDNPRPRKHRFNENFSLPIRNMLPSSLICLFNNLPPNSTILVGQSSIFWFLWKQPTKKEKTSLYKLTTYAEKPYYQYPTNISPFHLQEKWPHHSINFQKTFPYLNTTGSQQRQKHVPEIRQKSLLSYALLVLSAAKQSINTIGSKVYLIQTPNKQKH